MGIHIRKEEERALVITFQDYGQKSQFNFPGFAVYACASNCCLYLQLSLSVANSESKDHASRRVTVAGPF